MESTSLFPESFINHVKSKPITAKKIVDEFVKYCNDVKNDEESGDPTIPYSRYLFRFTIDIYGLPGFQEALYSIYNELTSNGIEYSQSTTYDVLPGTFCFMKNSKNMFHRDDLIPCNLSDISVARAIFICIWKK